MEKLIATDRFLTVYAERDYFRDLCKVLTKCKSDLDLLFSRHKVYLDCHDPEYNSLVQRYTDLEKSALSASIRFRRSVNYIKSSARRQIA